MKLVLLPGMDGTGLMFRPFIDIANNHSLEVISYPNDTRQSYSDLIGYVRERLPNEEDYIIIAESFSGPIAYGLMKEAVSNLKAVIFIASFLENPRPLLLSIQRVLPISLVFRLPIPRSFIRRYLLGIDASDSLINQFRVVLENVSPAVLMSRMRGIAGLKNPDMKVNYPCCYVRAEEDKLVTAKNVQIFRKFIPNIQIRSINGPHFLLQSRPEECLKIIDEEIRKLESM